MSHRKSGLRPIVLVSLFAFCSAPAFAERPMAVDDAGTLERGGAKLEFGWMRIPTHRDRPFREGCDR